MIRYFQNKSILSGDYFSDSKNEFSVKKIIQLQQFDNYTLVIHPEWWDSHDFEFIQNGIEALISSLRFDKIKKQSLKEILNNE